jgi:hypothetical protein
MFQVAPKGDSRAADITPQQHIASTHHHNTQQKITQSHCQFASFSSFSPSSSPSNFRQH